MDRFKETESSASMPGFRKAKKSTSNIGPHTGQPRRSTSEDVVMHELNLKISSAGGSTPSFSSGKFSNRIGDPDTGRSTRQPGNTFPQTRKKTIVATKVSPLLVATKSMNTPRVRFAQQKSTITPRPSPIINDTHAQNATPSFPFPGRKVGSSPLFRKPQPQPQQATTSLQPTPFSVKIARPFLPLWQQLDEEHQRVSKRRRDVRRISSAHQSRQNAGQEIDQTRNKAQIAPRLHLRLNGEMDISSTEDEDHRPRRPPTKISVKLSEGRQIAVKKSAARKIEIVDTTTSDEASESGSTMDNDSQEDQLFPEEYDLPQRPDSEQDTVLRPSTIFNPAPQITIALPQVKAEPEDNLPVGGLAPHEELVNAVEALTISPIRMQSTRQLPFLRRNLRQGFLSRCANVLIPIHPDQKQTFLEVTYEYVDGIVFQAKIEDWLCPLCNLFGKFTTQATLYCHLKWDHQEVFSEWKKIEESDVRQRWKLQVMIPQEVRDDRHPQPQDETEDEREQDEEEEGEDAEVSDGHTHESPPMPASTFSSPFPLVALSPFSPRQDSQIEQNITTSPDIPSPSKIKLSRETSPPPPISRYISVLQLSSSRSRSMTGVSQNTMATTTQATPRIPREARYPSPPPPDDPLGPAARPPYLPAYSEYGGPTVYYSCRPGGACLFDLLGTLPMKEFGILEWEVLDREEEIYESDDVREEYKIMHALWGRWIMRHRNGFISNYHQGTLAFVNYYWRMIHRAAGWDALRYWLLILLANQFLNAQEVSQVLTHYEELTGMASWCDPP